MRRTDRDFRYHPEASKDFLMESPAVAAHLKARPRLWLRYGLRLPSSFFLSWFVSDSAAMMTRGMRSLPAWPKPPGIAPTRYADEAKSEQDKLMPGGYRGQQ
jgi:hypothetical protein